MNALQTMQFCHSWYPADIPSLDALLTSVSRPEADITGGCVPHAGLRFSRRGQLALLPRFPTDLRHVVLLSPSHYRRLPVDSLYTADVSFYQTPYGNLPGANVAASSARANVALDAELLAREHGIELLLPALKKYANPSMDLAAFVLPELTSLEQVQRFADILEDICSSAFGNEPWLLLVSSDFTHYGPRFRYEPFGCFEDVDVRKHVAHCDMQIARLLAGGDYREAFLSFQENGRPTICGIHPLLVQSVIASRRGWNGRLVDYYDSSQVEGLVTTGLSAQRSKGDPNAVAYAILEYRRGESEGGMS